MYNLINISGNRVESEFHNALISLDNNLYSRQSDSEIKANIYFLDLYSINPGDAVAAMDLFRTFFICFSQNNISTCPLKNIVIYNIDKNSSSHSKACEFISAFLENEIPQKGITIQIAAMITPVEMPNYARARFDYSDYFSAPAKKAICEIHQLIRSLADVTKDITCRV